MTARLPWNVRGQQSDAGNAATDAARRPGLSVGEWFNSAFTGNASPQASTAPTGAAGGGGRSSLDDVHARIDAISRQIAALGPAPQPTARPEQNLAVQLNDAISRLDRSLSHWASPQATAPLAPAAAPANGFDQAVAEFAQRQNMLDGRRSAPSRMAAPPLSAYPAYAAPSIAPAPGPDLAGIERHLQHLTGQIEQMRRPDTVDQAIAGFRTELAEIRQSLHDALPRRAIEQLESEIRSLARRIDETRHDGADSRALASIEGALGDIRAALRSLTPAEHLSGIEDTVRGLASKIDLIVRANQNPAAIEQLEAAITALRGITAHVASDETLSRLAENVHALSSKVDQLAHDAGSSELLSALEQRISQLTSALENRDRPEFAGLAPLETAVQSLVERIDRLQIAHEGPAAFAELESRIGALLDRFDDSDARFNYLAKIEGSLSESLQLLEQRRADFAAALPPTPSAAGPFVDSLRDEISFMRTSYTEAERRTQDSLDIVHSTLGHMVDRLAMIEGDIREARKPAAAPHSAEPSAAPLAGISGARPVPPHAAPIMPNPAQYAPAPHRSVPTDVAPAYAPASAPEPLDFVETTAPSPATASEMLAALDREPVMARTDAGDADAEHEIPPISTAETFHTPAQEAAQEIVPIIAAAEAHAAIESHAAAEPVADEPPPRPAPPPFVARPPIDPSLPPDHPLEPGTRVDVRDTRPAVERIAASQAVLAEVAPPREPRLKTNFIAAARRAAQAANANAPAEKPVGRATLMKDKPVNPGAPEHTTFSAKLRSLLVGVSVVVIVLGTLRVAINLFDGKQAAAPPPAAEQAPTLSLPPSAESASPPRIERENEPRDATPPASAPERQSMLQPENPGLLSIAPMSGAQSPALSATDRTATETTGSIDAPRGPKAGTAMVSGDPVYADPLPDAIGSAALRAAAVRGDAGAAYEIAFRYAEGRRVATNYDEAHKWYDRAARQGVVPAMFRLGGLYEKGLGVKKDLDVAKRYYSEAAERGYAKAMHNLAVLHADGGLKSPDYKTAAQWFRKAAERGITDSQYNLGILYARGIGLDQNMAEAFKWFSLAAAQGDADAGRKRDDIAKRLDTRTLESARLAVQSFIPERQPDEAVSVAAPAGGWDAATPPKSTAAKTGAPKSTPAKPAGAKPTAATPSRPQAIAPTANPTQAAAIR